MLQLKSSNFPAVWDATIRRSFASCPAKFLYSHCEQIAPIGPESVHLHAGGALAHGLETVRREFFTNQKSVDDSLHSGIRAIITYWGDYLDPQPGESGEYKTLERTVAALISYFDKYPLDSDSLVPALLSSGDLGVEVSFCLPVEGTKHPITGEPILYTGRFDMIAENKDSPGAYFIVDEKSTSRLGNTWAANWDLRSQFTGYCWGAQSYGLPVVGAIIRGIAFLKNGYSHAQALTPRPQWLIDRWLSNLRFDINRAIAYWRAAQWPQNLDESCVQFMRPCAFAKLCNFEDPSQLRDIYYHSHVWDPMKRDFQND